MTAFGIKVGTMTISKIKENDSVDVYTINSSAKISVLWMDRSDESNYEVRYCKGKLVSSTFKQVENGKLKRWTNVRSDGSQLLIDSYKGKRIIKGLPTFSVVCLYFNSPQNLSQLFYETEADFAPLKQTSANTFETTTSDGNRSVYHYVNGRIQEMEFHVTVATVHAKRI